MDVNELRNNILREIVQLDIEHYDLSGEVSSGVLEVHERISEPTVGAFKRLFDMGFPINSIEPTEDRPDPLLIRLNLTTGYNFRFIKNSDVLSKHALGICIDLNPLNNPAVPSKYYYDTSFDAGKITDEVVGVFEEFGFLWGGKIFKGFWDSHHFELDFDPEWTEKMRGMVS